MTCYREISLKSPVFYRDIIQRYSLLNVPQDNRKQIQTNPTGGKGKVVLRSGLDVDVPLKPQNLLPIMFKGHDRIRYPF